MMLSLTRYQCLVHTAHLSVPIFTANPSKVLSNSFLYHDDSDMKFVPFFNFHQKVHTILKGYSKMQNFYYKCDNPVKYSQYWAYMAFCHSITGDFLIHLELPTIYLPLCLTPSTLCSLLLSLFCI